MHRLWQRLSSQRVSALTAEVDPRWRPSLHAWCAGLETPTLAAVRGLGLSPFAELVETYAADPVAVLSLAPDGDDFIGSVEDAWTALDDPSREVLLWLCACVGGVAVAELNAGAPKGAKARRLAVVAELEAAGWLSGGERMRVPEPLRHLVNQRLATRADRERAFRSHAETMIDAAHGKRRGWLVAERANLEAVVRRFHELDPRLAVRAVLAVMPVVRFDAEPHALRELLMTALTSCASAPELDTAVRCQIAGRLIDQGAFDDAMRWLHPASLFEDRSCGRAAVLRGHVHVWRSEYTLAEQAFALAQRCAEEDDDEDTKLAVAMQRAFLAMDREDADASTTIDEATRYAERVDSARGVSIGYCLRGRQLLRAGSVEEAARWLSRSRARLLSEGDRRTAVFVEAYIARALRMLGRRERAAEVARAAHAWARDDVSDALELTTLIEVVHAEGVAQHRERLQHLCEVVQLSRLQAEGHALLAQSRAPRMILGPDATWVRLEETHLDLVRHRAPRYILARLCAEAMREGKPLGVASLFEAGWPGESIRFESQVKRVHTAIWTLRKLGLQEVIETHDAGYRLNASVHSDVV